MKILITGGAGYLGSILSTQLLKQGHQVRVLDSFLYGSHGLAAIREDRRLSILRGDIRDCGTIAEAMTDMDAVVHLAALVGDPVCSGHPRQAREVNLDASLALIDATSAARVSRFVFASTCSNYGRTDSGRLADEDTPLHPLSLYAETKVQIEQALLRNDSGLCGTVLRFSTLYGLSPRMRFDLTVNEFTLHLKLERRLAVFGQGYWRPYVHVGDAATAIISVLSAGHELVAGEVFNVGDSAENYRKSDIVDLILARVPDARVELVDKAEDPRDYRVSFDRIAGRLGYRITRRVPDGIAEILEALDRGGIDEPFHQRYRNELSGSATEIDHPSVHNPQIAGIGVRSSLRSS
jgi:nucleoside-diphosphate-sugar epimerase